MFLGGTIVLAGVTVLFLGQPTTEMCLVRPWFQHVALTFTLSCLLVKVRESATAALDTGKNTAVIATANTPNMMHTACCRCSRRCKRCHRHAKRKRHAVTTARL